MTESATAIGGAERSEFVHRIWPAYPRHLAALRAEVRRWLSPLALSGDAENDLLLAVNEAASNCVEHAYTSATVDGTVELTFWTEPGSVCVEIVDQGRWRTPSGQPTGRGRDRDHAAAHPRGPDPSRRPRYPRTPRPCTARPRRAIRGRMGRRPDRGPSREQRPVHRPAEATTSLGQEYRAAGYAGAGVVLGLPVLTGVCDVDVADVLLLD